MKKIQDYLPYYIGCRVLVDDKEYGVFTGGTFIPNSCNQIYYDIQTDEMKQNEEDDFSMPYNDDADEQSARIKPILRKINSITDDEWLEFEKQIPNIYDKNYLKNVFCHTLFTGENMHWAHINNALILLRKNHIDVDSLIKEGLAIDASTLTK